MGVVQLFLETLVVIRRKSFLLLLVWLPSKRRWRKSVNEVTTSSCLSVLLRILIVSGRLESIDD